MFAFERARSAYPDNAGLELEWLTADTNERFRANCKDSYARKFLETGNWIDNKFTYKFNSHGFRGDEFVESPNDSIVFLGCSHTVGIGIPYETTFAYIVATRLGLRNYNLGLGGGSNDSAFRVGSYWIPKLLPKAVVLVSPEPSRFEIVTMDSSVTASSFTEDRALKHLQKRTILNPINAALNQEKNILALTQICNDLKIPFVIYKDFEIPWHDQARDLIHRGPKSNEVFAKRILTDLESLKEKR